MVLLPFLLAAWCWSSVACAAGSPLAHAGDPGDAAPRLGLDLLQYVWKGGFKLVACTQRLEIRTQTCCGDGGSG